MAKINIAGLNKAKVLAALYNNAKPQGKGFLNYESKPMTSEEAQKFIDSDGLDFDYLKGRVMKVDISGDEFESWGYDRDNGEYSAQNTINELVNTGDPNSAKIQQKHNESTHDSAADTAMRLNDETKTNGSTMTLGLADKADELVPILDKVLRRKKQE